MQRMKCAPCGGVYVYVKEIFRSAPVKGGWRIKNSNFDSIFDPHSQKLYACVPPRGVGGGEFFISPERPSKVHTKCYKSRLRTWPLLPGQNAIFDTQCPKMRKYPTPHVHFAPLRGVRGAKIFVTPKRHIHTRLATKQGVTSYRCDFWFRLYVWWRRTKKKEIFYFFPSIGFWPSEKLALTLTFHFVPLTLLGSFQLAAHMVWVNEQACKNFAPCHPL